MKSSLCEVFLICLIVVGFVVGAVWSLNWDQIPIDSASLHIPMKNLTYSFGSP